MSAFTVYLFVRTLPGSPSSAASLRRLQALQQLRDELQGIRGLSVTPRPDPADLHVEITNVFASDDAPSRDGGRVVIVRLSDGEQHLDFVCADGVGHSSAERQAARRICAWLDAMDRGTASPLLTLPPELTVRMSDC